MEYTGYKRVQANNEKLNEFYEDKLNVFDLIENQYLLIENSLGSVADSYIFQNNEFKKVPYTKIGDTFTGIIKPRNEHQEILFHMLKDESIKVKLVAGSFGTGKTMALATAALEQISKGKFEKIVWVRNNIEVKDTVPLGALPGSEFDKLLPFAMPLADHCGGPDGLRGLIEDEKVEVVHLGFLRGRDIKNSIIVCSEAENLTKQHIQLLLGRVGEGSNLWLDGDLKQRDKAAFEKSAGLELMIERLKGNKLFGYVKLVKTERSETARLADLLDD